MLIFYLSFHTFKCHSETAMGIGQRLDYEGLVLMICGATVILIYYAFICNPELQVLYWTLTSLAALFSSFFNCYPGFAKPQLQPFRAISLAFLALSFFVAVVHSLAAYGLQTQTHRLALKWIVYALICHTFCAAAYATEVSWLL